jgi:tetratricopeptide (TPR) repeat protein
MHDPNGRFFTSGGVGHRRWSARPAAAWLAILALAACEGASGPPGAKPLEPAAVGTPGVAAEVVTLLAPRGSLPDGQGLASSGPAGRRLLAPGDKAGPGDTLETPAGLAVTLRLADGAQATLGAGGRLELGAGGGAALVLRQGELSLSRPVGALGALSLRVGERGPVFELGAGRVTASFTAGGGGGVRVDAGRLGRPDSGETFGPGHSLAIAATGEARPGLPPAAPLSLPSRHIEPLAPRLIPASLVPDVLRGIGTLTARVPGSGVKNETALQLVDHGVDVTIRDGVAVTRVNEAFRNDSNRTVEGTYRFVLPSRASITRLALEVNGRVEEGEVLEKKRAARIFKQIVEDSVRPRDPALLEWERGSTFTMKIFPIGPGETRRVFISYMEPLTAQDGRTRYVYPLGGPSGAARAGRFSFTADLASSLGLRDVRAPLYPARIEAAADSARVAFEAVDFTPITDLVIEFATREEAGELRVATQTERTGQGYALLLLRPAVDPPGSAPAPRRLIAVVDTSYGLPAEIRDLSHGTAVELLASLDPADGFQLLACDSGCRAFSPRYEAPTASNLERAFRFLAAIPPGGASDIAGAVEHAYSLARDGRGAVVVYLGDGVATAGERDPGRLARLLGATRPPGVVLHAVGLGPELDEVALDALAHQSGGSAYALSVGESPAAAAFAVARRILAPGLAHATVDWPAGIVDAPRYLGYLPAGGELAVTARLDRQTVDGEAVLRALAPDGRPIERRFRLRAEKAAPEAGFIAGLWAKDQLDRLQLATGRDAEIVELSRRMRVASRLTSWIVLENDRMYERFKVQRTDAGEWAGEGAAFANAQAAAEPDLDDGALDSLGGLAAGDLEADERESAGSGLLGAGRGGGGTGTGYGSPGAAPAAPAKLAEESKKDKAAGQQAPVAANRPRTESAERAGRDLDDQAAPRPVTADIASSIPVGGGLGTSWGMPRCDPRPVYDIRIQPAAGDGTGLAARASEAGLAVRANPTSRKAHARYLALLGRASDTGTALAAAREWVAQDPLGASALAALGDQLARNGDRAEALRAYAAIAEVEPGNTRNQRRLGAAFRDAGLHAAAAGHFRVAADLSRDPADALEYGRCLAAAGRFALLERELERLRGERSSRTVRGQLEALLDTARTGLLPQWGLPGARGELTVSLELDNPWLDVDLSVVDPAGRRLSGVWGRGSQVSDLTLGGSETLSLSSLMNGTYLVAVSRAAPAAAAAAAAAQPRSAIQPPLTGRVTIKVRDKQRTVPFVLHGADARVAQVSYKKTQPRCRW